MKSTPPTPEVLDPAQLRRIEAMHKGLLYQHLYGVACLIKCAEWGWSRMLVEADEDIELDFPGRHVYAQVKTRTGVIKPDHVARVLDRFERYRQAHAARSRAGHPDLVLALNADPSPVLASRIVSGAIPPDIRITRPGHSAAQLPPPWPDVDAAFDWCVQQAEGLPFSLVAPDVLVLKLAGLMQRVASGTGDYASHAIDASQTPALLEQFVHQVHEFPAPPLNYKQQDKEPDLNTTVPVRLIVGFSGAGKTSWAAQCTVEEEKPNAYLDVADLPSTMVAHALARDLIARWLGADLSAMRLVSRSARSGLEALRSACTTLSTHEVRYTVVIDNAHRLEAEAARAIAESMQGVRLVFLAQPTSELSQLAVSLGVEPEMLRGWSEDTIAAEAQAEKCRASVEAVRRIKRLTAGLPLYVRSALRVSAIDFEGDLSAFCDALEAQSLVTETSQLEILTRVFEGLSPALKQVLACAALADVPVSADELLTITRAAFDLERSTVIRSLRSLRSSGLLQAYGSQQSKVHDAMRPTALEHLGTDPRAERRAKEALLSVVEASLGRHPNKDRYPLFIKMLVELRKIEKLADMTTSEQFHEVGSFPDVWRLLEEGSSDESLAPSVRFDCLDGLIFHRQKNGRRDAIGPLLAAMKAVLALYEDDRAQLVYMQKSMLHLSEAGDRTGAQDLILKTRAMLPTDPTFRRIFEYNAAVSFWNSSLDAEAQQMIQPLAADYLSSLGVDLQRLVSGDVDGYLTRIRENSRYGDDCKRLADCLDFLARILDRRRQKTGQQREAAIRLYELTASWDSAAKVSIDLTWHLIAQHQFQRGRDLVEHRLLLNVRQHGLNDRLIPVRALHAHLLGKTGDIEAARREIQAIDPYLASLPELERKDALNLTAFLR